MKILSMKQNEIIDSILSKQQQNLIEQWTGKKIENVLFYSERDNWKRKNCELNEKINGKKQLLFLIESKEGEKFGYYLSSKVENKTDKNGFHSRMSADENSFHFNLESNGRLKEPMKFEIRRPKWGYRLFDEFDNCLIGIGDIYLYKQEQNVGQCLQQNESSFEYYNIENALCGKTFPQQFEMKQFVVIELLTQREKIDDMGNEEKMKLGLSIEQIKQLEEWTKKQMKKKLFDSEVDDWDKETSVFTERIVNRSNLLFIIEDNQKNQFGYYENGRIEEEYVNMMCADEQSFLFNIQSNGRLQKMMKFEIVNVTVGYNLYDKSADELIILGGTLMLYKKKLIKFNSCYQDDDDFLYHGIENALTGEEGAFVPVRILVIQMM